MYATVVGLCVFSTYNGLCLRINWEPVDGDQDGVITSPIDGISGYNIYRASNQLGTYTRLNTSAIQGLTYLDSPAKSYGWRLTDNMRNEWWYKVSCQGLLGESPLSSPATFYPYWAFDNPPINGGGWEVLL